LQAGPFHGGTGDAAIIIEARQRSPALSGLALDIGGASLTLGIETVEGLIETLFGALARVLSEQLRLERGDVVH
tara:strand:+ start:1318 stop:1539 length:222 start_codon:yes stop_codon:yes gene_type:complete